MSTPLDEYGLTGALKRNAMYPMHMPGHKRNPRLTPPLAIWQDITEIAGFDDLHHPTGLLAETQRLAALLYGSKHAFLLVNGSTCGNLAAIRALHRQYGGTEMIVVGATHPSVTSAAELCGLTIVSREHATDAKICVATSPDYYGVTLDVLALADEMHSDGIILHVDSAHGAHLGFHPYFPENAVKLGADVVVESLHKTLPAFGQTSVLHVCSDSIDLKEIALQLSVFETSSPSYILMSGADYCLRLIEKYGTELFDSFSRRLKRFYAAVSGVDVVRQPTPTIDPSRIVISGDAIPGILRSNRIEPERVTSAGTILITTICDEDEIFDTLIEIIKGDLK